MSTERSDASGAHEDSTAPDAPKDPFAILGVELDASDQDVRRAYAQAIRTARASGDAEAAQRVQWAFEAIRDPKGRGQWREHLRQRSQHAVLFERVDEALEAGDLARAFDQVRTILEISPDLERALSLAYALSRDLGHIEEATIFAKRLAQVNRGNRHHIGRFARALAARALVARDDAQYRGLLDKALHFAKKARDLGEDPAPNALFRSQLLWRLERQDEAREVLESALESADDLRSAELELFLALVRVDMMARDLRGVCGTLKRMDSMLPEDPDRRLTIAKAVVELLVEALPVYPKAAEYCAKLAVRCVPDEPYPRELLAGARQAAEVCRQREAETARANAAADRAHAAAERRRWRHNAAHVQRGTRVPAWVWIAIVIGAIGFLRLLGAFGGSDRRSWLERRSDRVRPEASAPASGGRSRPYRPRDPLEDLRGPMDSAETDAWPGGRRPSPTGGARGGLPGGVTPAGPGTPTGPGTYRGRSPDPFAPGARGGLPGRSSPYGSGGTRRRSVVPGGYRGVRPGGTSSSTGGSRGRSFGAGPSTPGGLR